jgi:spore coat protein U-like protein
MLWVCGAQQTFAACNLTVQAVSLGNYDFMDRQPLDSVGHVIVACDAATSYRVSLSPGNGSYASRALTSGGHRLIYNLYSDVNHISVWGDGSGGTVSVSGSAAGSGSSDDKIIYASVPAGQNPYVGAYNDAVVVTLEF